MILDAVEAADIQPGDRVLEIGPGTGNLTAELLKAGARVVAVEKDKNLAMKLPEQFVGDESFDLANLDVVEADFLKWNVAEAFARDDSQPRAKVVANIPYNITTDVLKTLLPLGHIFSDMIFMFQEEVAQRLIRDDAGASDYRPMSVRVQFYSVPRYVRSVPPLSFLPPPNVQSCLVGFRPKQPSELLELKGTERQFFSFVQVCFAQKRKMLKNNLKAVCDPETVQTLFKMLGRHEKTRPQELAMDEFVTMFNYLREDNINNDSDNKNNSSGGGGAAAEQDDSVISNVGGGGSNKVDEDETAEQKEQEGDGVILIA